MENMGRKFAPSPEMLFGIRLEFQVQTTNSSTDNILSNTFMFDMIYICIMWLLLHLRIVSII